MALELFSILVLVVQLLIIWIVVLLSAKLVASGIGALRAFVLAFLAYFLPPLVFSFFSISIPYAAIIIPLIVWIILGELLLREATLGGRLKITIVAFIIYLILQFIGLPGIIIGLAG
ncbi:MAG: hypothetical protein HYW25_05370 [Candidatus Aenigmarchaeota archaeon]|nr:hypothetical protein [Candidatus Aenigmarchaeota archaeon]